MTSEEFLPVVIGVPILEILKCERINKLFQVFQVHFDEEIPYCHHLMSAKNHCIQFNFRLCIPKKHGFWMFCIYQAFLIICFFMFFHDDSIWYGNQLSWFIFSWIKFEFLFVDDGWGGSSFWEIFLEKRMLPDFWKSDPFFTFCFKHSFE